MAATLTGVCGLSAALLGLGKTEVSATRAKVIIVLCLLALVGVGLDTWGYYSKPHVSGNYYAWFMIAPYYGALAVMTLHARRFLSAAAAAQSDAEEVRITPGTEN